MKKRNKKFDLGKVSGGLSVGGAIDAKGSVMAKDSREVINNDADHRNFNIDITKVDVDLKAKVRT